MKLAHRRRFLHLAAGAAALPAVSPIARAQTYPSRPVRCIVGYPPGGGTDIFVRLVGPPLSERLGQPFIIENRAGAASNVATEVVVRAPPMGIHFLVQLPLPLLTRPSMTTSASISSATSQSLGLSRGRLW